MKREPRREVPVFMNKRRNPSTSVTVRVKESNLMACGGGGGR